MGNGAVRVETVASPPASCPTQGTSLRVSQSAEDRLLPRRQCITVG